MTRKVHIFTLEAKVFVKRDGKPYPEEASRMPSLKNFLRNPLHGKCGKKLQGCPVC